MTFHSFDLSDEDKKKYKSVKNKFDSHFLKRKNIIYERTVFNRRKQEEGECRYTHHCLVYSVRALKLWCLKGGDD